MIFSVLDEDLKPPKNKFCSTGLFKLHRNGVVKQHTLFHIYKGNTDLKMNGLSGRHTSPAQSLERKRK
jgi:hypothetical protein